MKLHKEGTFHITIAFSIMLIAGIVLWNVPTLPDFLRAFFLLPFLVLTILVIWFFRIPKRTTAQIPGGVVAPADGKIVVIEKVIEEEYFKDERIQISIFMSPLNVHQNVYPISGEVVYKAYHKGKYLVAWHPKSSTENERATVVIRRDDGTEILIRQIAGAVARRIRTYAKEGEKAETGEEMGFIKFGSRVDVFLPTDAKVNCNLEQKARNKLTLLAQL